jgi:hypothetical protein
MSYTDLDEEDVENLDRGDSFDSDVDDEDLEEDQEDSDDEDQEEDQEDLEDLEEEEDLEEVEEEPKQKDIKIPKSRLDKALRQRDELRERSLWLEEQLEKLINNQQAPIKEEIKVEATYDFDSAEEQYANLLIEGDTANAAKLRREIEVEKQKELRALIADIKKSNEEEVSNKIKTVTDNEKFTLLINDYENKYPFLDSDSDEANEEAIDTINTLMSGYLAKGLSKTDSLRKAVEKALPMYVKETSTKKSIGDTRKAASGRKAAQAAKAQPAKTKTSTSTKIDTSKIDIAKMSERDFSKLTPRELKALRGD